jgi:uncharacterized protein
LQDQLALLRELQAIDSAIQAVQVVKQTHPQKMSQLDGDMERKKSLLDKERAALEEVLKQRHKQEQSLKMETERLQKSQDKLLAVKTNKEYQAALKEIESLKQANNDLETEILICMEKADVLSRALQEKENEHRKLVQEYEDKKKALEEALGKADVELKRRQVVREERLVKIQPDLLRVYEMLREKRQGLAVVAVQGGLCSGCNINIPPQQSLEIRRNNSIERCPFCNRILFFEETSVCPGASSDGQ